MNHYVDYNTRPREYGNLNKFQFRMDYKTMNNEVSENIYKFFMHGKSNIFIHTFIRILNSIVKTYEAAGFKKQDIELSNTDYLLFYLIKNYGFAKRLNSKQGILKIIASTRNLVKQINTWKKEENSDEIFHISQIINNIGVIKFLELDKEKTISRLIHRYRGKKQGISLLIDLMKERYRKINQAKTAKMQKN